jgi:hypothetical protein
MYGFLEKAKGSNESGKHYQLKKANRKNLDNCVKQMSQLSNMEDTDKL